MRSGRAIRRVLGPVGALLIAAGVAAVPAGRAEAVTAPGIPATVLAGTGVLNDVVGLTARDAWAVGHYGGLANPKTLIEHWNGTAWHRVSVSPSAGWLDGVAATSARDIWAVGCTKTFGNIKARPLVLHWNGTAWN